VALGGVGQRLGDLVEGIVPGNRPERVDAPAFLADPAQRLRQALGVAQTTPRV